MDGNERVFDPLFTAAARKASFRMKVIGHRGAAGLAPENTFAGFDIALALGVDGIETEVQKTQDGKLVLFHDHLLEKTTKGTAALKETPWQALQQLDAGSWFDRTY